jgi:hypothetical protein
MQAHMDRQQFIAKKEYSANLIKSIPKETKHTLSPPTPKNKIGHLYVL